MMISLCVRPVVADFRASGSPALLRTLRAMADATRLDDLDDPADLRLDAEGRLPCGYKFTALGLQQVCNLLAPGLFALIRDLAGSGVTPAGVDASPHSPLDAIRIYNRVLAVRGGAIGGGRRLLRHTADRVVEGVLGAQYAVVENAEVFERAAEAAEERGRGCTFHAARLVGRRLAFRFLDADHAAAVAGRDDRGTPQPDVWRGGLHYANSEVSGESTVRGAFVLVRGCDGAAAMGPFLGGRRVHAGRDLALKLSLLFRSAADAGPPRPKLESWLARLRAAPLGFAPGGDDEALVARSDALARQLAAHGVPRGVAQAAVATALHRGSYGGGLGAAAWTAAGTRTEFDLFNALAAQGSGLYATTQEAVEQAAFALLAGRITIA